MESKVSEQAIYNASGSANIEVLGKEEEEKEEGGGEREEGGGTYKFVH